MSQSGPLGLAEKDHYLGKERSVFTANRFCILCSALATPGHSLSPVHKRNVRAYQVEQARVRLRCTKSRIQRIEEGEMQERALHVAALHRTVFWHKVTGGLARAIVEYILQGSPEMHKLWDMHVDSFIMEFKAAVEHAADRLTGNGHTVLLLLIPHVPLLSSSQV